METFAALKKAESKQKATNNFLGSPANKPFIQPKLSVNQPNDVYEQEADAMADKVMRMEQPGVQLKPLPVTALQRKCAHCQEEEKQMQRKEISNTATTADSSLENYVGNLSSGGQQLPADVRDFYEPKFGYDFSNVKVHTDNVAAKSAQSINALAYTSGNNIVFNEGQYTPGTDSGKRLLGHELTHVIQQSSSGTANVQKKDAGSTLKEKEDCKFLKITTSAAPYPPGFTGGMDSNNIFLVVNWCGGTNKGDIKLGVDVPATAKRIGDKIVNAAINGTLDRLGDELKTEELTPFIDIILRNGSFALTAHGEITVGLDGAGGGKGSVIFSKGPFDIEGNIEKDDQGLQGGIKLRYTPGRKTKAPECKTRIVPLKILCECKLPPQTVKLDFPPIVKTESQEVFIYFPHWSYDIEAAKKDATVKSLNEASMPLLETMVGDEYKVTEITGYTSPEGSLEKINTKLSQDRADAVKSYIEEICKPKSLLAMRPPCAEGVLKDVKPLGMNELYGSNEAGKELKGKKLAENTVKQFTENEQEAGRRDEAFMKSLEKLTPQQKADKIYPRLRRVRVALKKTTTKDLDIPVTLDGGTVVKECPPEIADHERLQFMLRQ